MTGGRRLARCYGARLDAGEMGGVVGEAAGRPELAIADAVDPDLDCLVTISAMAGVTCAAMTAGSVISALASRPGMSSTPWAAAAGRHARF